MDKSEQVALSNAVNGEIYKIKRFDAITPADRRLLDLGFVEGTTVSLIGAAPMGETFAVRIRGAILCVRRQQAEKILLERFK